MPGNCYISHMTIPLGNSLGFDSLCVIALCCAEFLKLCAPHIWRRRLQLHNIGLILDCQSMPHPCFCVKQYWKVTWPADILRRAVLHNASALPHLSSRRMEVPCPAHQWDAQACRAGVSDYNWYNSASSPYDDKHLSCSHAITSAVHSASQCMFPHHSNGCLLCLPLACSVTACAHVPHSPFGCS